MIGWFKTDKQMREDIADFDDSNVLLPDHGKWLYVESGIILLL